MFSFAFSLLGGSFLGNMVLLPSKKEKMYMLICCAATIVNVVLNTFLIPVLGAIGAAGTTAICSFLMMTIMVFTRDRRVKLDYIWKTMLYPAIGSVFIFLYCRLIRSCVESLSLRTIICILGSLVLYLLVSILMKNEILYEFIEKMNAKLRGVKSDR